MTPSFRVATAMDIHAFIADDEAPTRTLWLGCIEFPDARPLAGHSDADPAAHALANAILMASGVGELGSVFGVDRPEWKGASGRALLEESVRLARAEGWQVSSGSVQLLCQTPRIGHRREEMTAALSAIAGGPIASAASSTDHLGFLGRKEGIAAIATVMLVATQA